MTLELAYSGVTLRDYFRWILNACKFSVTCFCFWIFPFSAAAQFSSEILYYENDRLIYISDKEGNRIPDFSHAGYLGGGVPLPNAPVLVTISPVHGDNTQHIQSAINSIRNFPADENGIRGAVKLNPGVYNIDGNLYLNRSGVILRGAGDGSNPEQNSIIRVSRNVQGTVLLIGDERASWHRQVGVSVNIITDFVPVSSRTFEVEDATFFEIGDHIIIRHPSTQEWIDAVDGGGTEGAPQWQPRENDIMYYREITDISKNVISVDAPIFNHLDKNLAQSYIYKHNTDNILSNVGVENLRIMIQTIGPDSETHAENGIIFHGVRNGWADRVTLLHFSHIGFGTIVSSNITISNSKALEPHSRITGRRRYNFNADLFSNNILVRDVFSSDGRRSFISNGATVASGIVFHNATSLRTLGSSEGHQKWTHGLLYDNIIFTEPLHYNVLALHNRGNFGSSHGWSSAHSVAWNVNANERYIFIQKPPTAQNYGIGNHGRVSGRGIFDHPEGYIEGSNQIPNPESLYMAQLEQRIKYGVPPDAPAKLTASNQVKNQVILKWTHTAIGEIEYLIERSEDGKNFQKIGTAAKSDSLFVDADVIDKTYHYRLRAYDGKNKSAYSNPVRITPNFNDDAISDFRLQLPLNKATFILKFVPDEFINFMWHKAKSNFDLTYTWYLDSLDGDFTNPILKKESIQNPQLSLSLMEINRLFNDQGIEKGDTLRAKWTVNTVSNIYEKWSETTHEINIIRHHEPLLRNLTDNYVKLDQNFPNPFNPSTIIRYQLSEPSYVRLDIFDLVGTRVATLVDKPKEQGTYDVIFNADNLASGIYLYRIFTDQQVQTRKMILIK